MLVEVLFGFVVGPKHWPAALINHEGRDLCGFVHVKFN